MKKFNLIYIEFEKFINNLLKNNLNKNRFCIAISGGPDSTLLLYLFKVYLNKYNNVYFKAIHIIHKFNNQNEEELKYEEAGSIYCENICKNLNIDYEIYDDKKIIVINNGSYEDASRLYRYNILKSWSNSNNLNWIAFGHNFNDNVENFFIRLYRGVSLSGLMGIKSINGDYIRPILNIKKSDIIDATKELGVNCFVDKDNTNNLKLRSNIRNNLLPILYSIDNRFEINFLKLINNINDAYHCIDFYCKKEWIILFDENNKCINYKYLIQLPVYIQKELLIKYICICNVNKKFINDNIFKEILRFCNNKNINKHQIEKYIIYKKKEYLFINNIEI